MTCTKLPWMVGDKNPFWVSAHGAKEVRNVNGWHVGFIKWRFVSHLRARDVVFDGVVHHPRVEELVWMRVFDMLCHRSARLYAVLTNPRLASSNFA
jgi:hypothetical protein